MHGFDIWFDKDFLTSIKTFRKKIGKFKYIEIKKKNKNVSSIKRSITKKSIFAIIL